MYVSSNRGRPLKANSWLRKRAQSDGNITDHFNPKRKRDQDTSSSLSDLDHSVLDNTVLDISSASNKTHGKRKKILRSSTPTPQDSIEMEDKLDRILVHLEKIEKQSELVKKELYNEIRDLRGDINKRLRSLEIENADLKKTNEELLVREKQRDKLLENHDRTLKKRNAIITGLKFKPDNLVDDLNKFFHVNFGINSALESGRIFGSGKILVTFSMLQTKIEVMKLKSQKLFDKKIYIEHDLTEKQRYIAYKGRCLVKDAIKNGGQAKAYSNKVNINNQWLSWNEKEEKFTPMNMGKKKPNPVNADLVTVLNQQPHNASNSDNLTRTDKTNRDHPKNGPHHMEIEQK